MAESYADLRDAALIHSLRTCQLFVGLPQTDLANIAKITLIKSMKKGEYLFREGDTARGFYIVQGGAVNVHRVSSTGKERVIHIFRVGESFAEIALASDEGYPADARAVETSQVLMVQKSGFVALLRRQPELALRMLGSMSTHLRVLVGQIEELTLRDVETRLANWLVKRCPKPLGSQSVEIELEMTKRVIAEELGTVSETLSRTFAKFREQELVLVKGKTVSIPSPIKLAALLSRNLGEETQDADRLER